MRRLLLLVRVIDILVVCVLVLAVSVVILVVGVLVLVQVQVVLVLVACRDLCLVLRPVTLLVGALGVVVLATKETGLLVARSLMRDVALVLRQLGDCLGNCRGDLWHFWFLSLFFLDAFPAFLVKDDDCFFLLTHGGGDHALLVTRDVVGRPLAAGPGVEAILMSAACREAHVTGHALRVTFTLVLLVVACKRNEIRESWRRQNSRVKETQRDVCVNYLYYFESNFGK